MCCFFRNEYYFRKKNLYESYFFFLDSECYDKENDARKEVK